MSSCGVVWRKDGRESNHNVNAAARIEDRRDKENRSPNFELIDAARVRRVCVSKLRIQLYRGLRFAQQCCIWSPCKNSQGCFLNQKTLTINCAVERKMFMMILCELCMGDRVGLGTKPGKSLSVSFIHYSTVSALCVSRTCW